MPEEVRVPREKRKFVGQFERHPILGKIGEELEKHKDSPAVQELFELEKHAKPKHRDLLRNMGAVLLRIHEDEELPEDRKIILGLHVIWDTKARRLKSKVEDTVNEIIWRIADASDPKEETQLIDELSKKYLELWKISTLNRLLFHPGTDAVYPTIRASKKDIRMFKKSERFGIILETAILNPENLKEAVELSQEFARDVDADVERFPYKIGTVIKNERGKVIHATYMKKLIEMGKQPPTTKVSEDPFEQLFAEKYSLAQDKLKKGMIDDMRTHLRYSTMIPVALSNNTEKEKRVLQKLGESIKRRIRELGYPEGDLKMAAHILQKEGREHFERVRKLKLE